MKSWISKALLGLFIAAPSVMAYLPKAPGKYGGLYLRTTGFTTVQKNAIRNGFGLWLQQMAWNLTPNATKFRIVDYPDLQDQVAAITFTKVNGISPVACGSGDSRYCAYTLTRNYLDGETYNAVSVNIYSQVRSNGVVVNVPLTNENGFQNLATYLAGQVLDPNVASLGSTYLPEIGGYSNYPVIPYGVCNMDFYSGVSSYDGQSCVSNGLSWRKFNTPVPLLVYSRLFNGKRLNYFMPTDGYYNRSSDSSMRIISARYMTNETIPADDPGATHFTIKNHSGRIHMIKNGSIIPGCYSTLPYGYNFVASTSEQGSGVLPSNVSKNLGMSQIVRLQNSVTDHITSPNPSNCVTEIGWVGDLLQGE